MFYPDGTRKLASGGWETVTTAQRIREYGSRYLVPIRGDWFVRAEDDPNDPHPLSRNAYPGSRAQRSVPKPYHAPDPGPEPVDDGIGCIASTSEQFEASEYRAVYSEPPKPWEYAVNRFYSDGSGPRLMVHRATVEHVTYGEASHDWRVQGTYKQCPHCKAFQAKHERWRTAMFGPRWGRGSGLGYQKMCDMLEMFGTRDGWQEAYIEDFRTVRALNQRAKAWETRNLIPFYGGITVTPEGLVPLKAKRAHCRKLKLAEQEQRRQERVHLRVRRQQEALDRKMAARRKRERAVRRQVAHALAESIATELTLKASEYPAWKRGEL